MKALVKSVVGTIGLLLVMQASRAGISLDATRLIFTGNSEGKPLVKTVVVSNNVNMGRQQTRSAPFLIKTAVVSYDKAENNKGKFVAAPPLFRLDPGNSMGVQIQLLNPQALPTDRESIFRLNVTAIPPAPPKDLKNYMAIVLTSSIKAFYRPLGLVGKPEEAYKQLTFHRLGRELVVNNPTPYYVSFQTLTVGGKKVEQAWMVAPKSQVSYPLPVGASGNVNWQAINDYGGPTEMATQVLP